MESEYLFNFLGHKRYCNRISRLVKRIQESGIKFDAIAYSGCSGALVAAPLAIMLKKHLILVRKEKDNTHSFSIVEGCSKNNCHYIVVDDFIESGSTVKYIIENINDKLFKPICVGVFTCHGFFTEALRAAHKNKWTFPISILKYKKVIKLKKFKKYSYFSGEKKSWRNCLIEEK